MKILIAGFGVRVRVQGLGLGFGDWGWENENLEGHGDSVRELKMGIAGATVLLGL